MKFVQRCEKKKKKKIYKNTQKVHYEVHKNHIKKSTSDSLIYCKMLSMDDLVLFYR